MKSLKIHTPQCVALVLAAISGLITSTANAERIFYDSFEVADANGDPIGWLTAGHPDYLGVATENSTWTTTYGEHGMSTYSSGIGTRGIGSLPEGSVDVDGDYTVKFNITGNASKGEYRAELWAFDWSSGPRLLGYAVGDTDGSKDMSFAGQITWRYNYNDWLDPESGYSTMEGAALQIKLMQDPNRSDWRNTPIWDNVSVDWIPDVDTTGPTVVDMVDDKNGGTVAPNTLVTYTVTFSEDMDATTVDASDFGNAGNAAILNPVVEQVSPQVFLVKVTPTEEGSLHLKINEGAILKDAVEPVANAMETFSSIFDPVDLKIIDVDGTNPILLPSDIVDDKGGGSVSPGTLVTYTLTFSKDMNDQSVTSADFDNDGDALFSIGTITETSPTSGIFTVQVTPSGPGTLRLRIKSGEILLAQDNSQLDNDPQIADDTILVVDGTPPTLASADITDDTEGSPVAVGTLVTYDVFFSEDMDASTVDAADFGNAVTVGNAPFTIHSVEASSPGVFRIELTPTGTGTIQLQVNLGAVLKDEPGNNLDTTPAIIDDTTVTVVGGDPYETWSGGLAFKGDGNDDGVIDGMAWLLGAATPSANAIALLPAVSQSSGNLVLNFTCLKTANRGGAVLKVQYSKDMGQTDPWHDAEVPDVDITVNSVIFDTTDAGNQIDVVATIPASAASPGTRLFARLSGASAP